MTSDIGMLALCRIMLSDIKGHSFGDLERREVEDMLTAHAKDLGYGSWRGWYIDNCSWRIYDRNGAVETGSSLQALLDIKPENGDQLQECSGMEGWKPVTIAIKLDWCDGWIGNYKWRLEVIKEEHGKI